MKFALIAFAFIHVVTGLPNCDKETNDHCLGEGADFSPEGIKACVTAVKKKSTDCEQYLTLMEECADDLKGNGACAADHANSDGIVCLMQRVDRTKLTDRCQKAVPEEKKARGLRGKYWTNGKRKLTKKELRTLKGEDLKVYNNWLKRQKKKGRKAKDKEYAILMQKRAKTRKLVIFKAASTMANSMADDGKSEADAKKIGKKVISQECRKYRKKDKDLKYTKDEKDEMLKDAVKAAKTQLRNRDL